MRGLARGRGSWARAVLGAALVTALAMPAVSEPDTLEPAPGRFLVAKRQVQGSLFARSIVLLVEASAQGAAGLIVNRPTALRLGELMNDVPDARDDRVHMGGPVAPRGMLFLVRSEHPPGGSRRIRGDLYLGESAAGLRELLARDQPAEPMRSFLGHAGWAAGQLEHEIGRGDWFVIEGDLDLAFDGRGDESWEQQLEALEALRVRAPGTTLRVVRR